MHGHQGFNSVIRFLGRVILVYLLLTAFPVLLQNISYTEKLIVAAVIFCACNLVFEDKKKHIILTVLVTTILFSVWYIDVHTCAVNLEDGCLYLAFCVCETVLFEIVTALINRNRYTRWLFFPFSAILFLPIIVCWCYYFLQGVAVGVDVWIALLQTNVSESIEYIGSYALNKNGFFALLSIVFWAYVIYIVKILADNSINFLFCNNLKRYSKKISNKSVVACSVIYIMAMSFLAVNVCQRISTNVRLITSFRGTKEYIADCKAFELAKIERTVRLKNIKIEGIVSESKKEEVYILILGESQNKDYMSAYGYGKETTPWLNMIKNDCHMVLFKNAYSCHVQTVPVLSYALTSKNQYNKVALVNALSIIDIANAAGFNTVWLSNQTKYGVHETPTSIIVSGAKQQFWTDGNCYDEKINDMLKSINIQGNMLIVIHLMGNHGTYTRRYPRKFEKFGIGSEEDEYNNSILYNDYVVKKIFENVKAKRGVKALVYIPDHAESVKDSIGHDANKYTPAMTHIPMYAYFSDEYIKENKEKFAYIKSHAESYFTNDLLFNFMAGIMDIKIDEIYEPENDITTTAYNGKKDRFRTMHGKRKLD